VLLVAKGTAVARIVVTTNQTVIFNVLSLHREAELVHVFVFTCVQGGDAVLVVIATLCRVTSKLTVHR